jgi:hypothetical protein
MSSFWSCREGDPRTDIFVVFGCFRDFEEELEGTLLVDVTVSLSSLTATSVNDEDDDLFLLDREDPLRGRADEGVAATA